MASSADPTKDTSVVETTTEITPLLGAPESGITTTENGKAIPPPAYGAADHGSREEDQPLQGKPMPYLQIILLCYASLVEPVAYFSIFPFISEMIARNGGFSETQVGFWAGMIESLFSLVQMLLMIFYGRLADRVGRKPVLVFSLVGVSFATAIFGLSSSLGQMIAFRCLSGLFAGSVVTVRTMVSENTDKFTQGRAFSWYMFTRNMGIFIGPLVGGPLANPAKQFPRTFGHSEFFIKYPYALPTFVAGAICFTAALTSLFFLKETLDRNEVGGDSKAKRSMSTLEVLKAPGVPIVLFILAHSSLLGLGYTAVCPVFQYTSIENGGWSFNPSEISYFLALAGVSQALWMLLLFPSLQKKFGTGKVLKVGVAMWPLMLALYPLGNEMLRHGLAKPFYIIAPPLLVIFSGVSVTYACIQLCINDISPSIYVLGTVNGLALSVGSGVRAFAPAAMTSIFAVGVKRGWADGHLIWIILVVLALGLNVAVYFLPESAQGRPVVKSTTTEAGAEDDGVVR